jgi:hypothetical protein
MRLADRGEPADRDSTAAERDELRHHEPDEIGSAELFARKRRPEWAPTGGGTAEADAPSSLRSGATADVEQERAQDRAMDARAAEVAPRRRTRHPSWWLWVGLGVLLLVVLLVALPALIAEPVRRRLEHDVNQQLEGYRASIGSLSLQPIALAIELIDVSIVQEAHPDPPVAEFPRMRASVQWQAILSGAIVGDVVFTEPRLRIDLTQLRKEARDEVDVEDRGWQDALAEIYPLEINEFLVRNGSVTYVDHPDREPLEIDRVELVVNNVRNVWSPERTYPSDIAATAILFDEGKLGLEGHADFLAKPHLGMKVDIDLDGVPLQDLASATHHFNASIRGGILSAHGAVEFSPKIKEAHLESASLDGVDADFLMAKAKTGDAEDVVEAVGRSVEDSTQSPEWLVEVGRIDARKSTFGIRNEDADPPYRLFVNAGKLSVNEFTNRPGGPRSRLELDGRFMGSGATRLRASFLPTAKAPDLDLDLAIQKTDLTKLNPVWKEFGGFDVAKGRFSLFVELAVRDNRVDGYVKPLFEDVDVYDAKQDEDEGVFQKIYEGIVGGAAELLENQPRDTVAMKTDLSGPVSNPRASTLQILLSILRNAFVKAILPGLETHTGRRKD